MSGEHRGKAAEREKREGGQGREERETRSAGCAVLLLGKDRTGRLTNHSVLLTLDAFHVMAPVSFSGPFFVNPCCYVTLPPFNNHPAAGGWRRSLSSEGVPSFITTFISSFVSSHNERETKTEEPTARNAIFITIIVCLRESNCVVRVIWAELSEFVMLTNFSSWKRGAWLCIALLCVIFNVIIQEPNMVRLTKFHWKLCIYDSTRSTIPPLLLYLWHPIISFCWIQSGVLNSPRTPI
jgi:hypothetical protein